MTQMNQEQFAAAAQGHSTPAGRPLNMQDIQQFLSMMQQQQAANPTAIAAPRNLNELMSQLFAAGVTQDKDGNLFLPDHLEKVLAATNMFMARVQLPVVQVEHSITLRGKTWGQTLGNGGAATFIAGMSTLGVLGGVWVFNYLTAPKVV